MALGRLQVPGWEATTCGRCHLVSQGRKGEKGGYGEPESGVTHQFYLF